MNVKYLFVAAILHVVAASPISYYKQLSPVETARLAAWTPNSKEPMWQVSGQYQGDMVLTPNQRNGLIDSRFRWPDREIPYEFVSDFTEAEKAFMTESIDKEFSKTCVRPRLRRSTDVDYITITNTNTGCWSNIGRLGGSQEVNLQQNGCIYYGIIVHEMLHAAGFYHQQSASERDDYVEIVWENIMEGAENNFLKYDDDVVTSFGEKYDYGSILHYNKYAFSSNDLPTIVTKDPNAEIGQRDGLSPIDIAKLNKMYDCV